jgi:hypothetical protein
MSASTLAEFRISNFEFRIYRREEVIGLIEACFPRLGLVRFELAELGRRVLQGPPPG